ncbi:MAG TPA: hypothetical protein VGJ87_16850 [Roseiflexaceae bacterium]
MSEPQTAALALMRELNERIVLNLIRQAGPISRAALERGLGLRMFLQNGADDSEHSSRYHP